VDVPADPPINTAATIGQIQSCCSSQRPVLSRVSDPPSIRERLSPTQLMAVRDAALRFDSADGFAGSGDAGDIFQQLVRKFGQRSYYSPIWRRHKRRSVLVLVLVLVLVIVNDRWDGLTARSLGKAGAAIDYNYEFRCAEHEHEHEHELKSNLPS